MGLRIVKEVSLDIRNNFQMVKMGKHWSRQPGEGCGPGSIAQQGFEEEVGQPYHSLGRLTPVLGQQKRLPEVSSSPMILCFSSKDVKLLLGTPVFALLCQLLSIRALQCHVVAVSQCSDGACGIQPRPEQFTARCCCSFWTNIQSATENMSFSYLLYVCNNL